MSTTQSALRRHPWWRDRVSKSRGLALCFVALRVAVSWWALLTAVTAVLSPPVALVNAILLYPPLALVIGIRAAIAQHRALSGARAGWAPLALGHRHALSLDLAQEPALRMARGVVESTFGSVEQRLADGTLFVRISSADSRSWWTRALGADLLTITINEDGPGHSAIELAGEPAQRWFYRFLWVDGGRCRARVEALAHAVRGHQRAQREVNEATAHRDALQTRLSQAELLLLRAQIEPHFLFNTLAHLRSSIQSDPNAACAMLDQLVEFLRATSRVATHALTPLSAELSRVETYFKLMATRLGGRFRFTIDCEPDLGSCEVPAASVLILAENAIKHGIERIDTPGAVAVSCRREDDRLVITVHNDGPPLTPGVSSGVGLSNLLARLDLCFGSGADLCIEDGEHTGVQVSMRVPMRVPVRGDEHAR